MASPAARMLSARVTTSCGGAHFQELALFSRFLGYRSSNRQFSYVADTETGLFASAATWTTGRKTSTHIATDASKPSCLPVIATYPSSSFNSCRQSLPTNGLGVSDTRTRPCLSNVLYSSKAPLLLM